MLKTVDSSGPALLANNFPERSTNWFLTIWNRRLPRVPLTHLKYAAGPLSGPPSGALAEPGRKCLWLKGRNSLRSPDLTRPDALCRKKSAFALTKLTRFWHVYLCKFFQSAFWHFGEQYDTDLHREQRDNLRLKILWHPVQM